MLQSLEGPNVGATLRADLSASLANVDSAGALVEVEDYAEKMTRALARDGRFTGAIVMLYHDAPRADPHPYADLLAAVETNLQRAGLQVPLVLEVTEGQVNDYRHPQYSYSLHDPGELPPLDRCDPTYPLAILLSKIIDRDDICRWAGNRDHTWSHNRP